MPLEYWIVLWKAVLIGGAGLFALLTVVVTIGGAKDIVKLVRVLRSKPSEGGRDVESGI